MNGISKTHWKTFFEVTAKIHKELPRLQKKHRHQTRNKPLEDDLHRLLTGLGFQETLKKKLKARG
jgi:hypothetical protein